MILLADRNVSPHKILAQGQELTDEIGNVGGEQNIVAANLNFPKEIHPQLAATPPGIREVVGF